MAVQMRQEVGLIIPLCLISGAAQVNSHSATLQILWVGRVTCFQGHKGPVCIFMKFMLYDIPLTEGEEPLSPVS